MSESTELAEHHLPYQRQSALENFFSLAVILSPNIYALLLVLTAVCSGQEEKPGRHQ